MVDKASNLGYFQGFKVSEDIHFDILQFVDDTFCFVMFHGEIFGTLILSGFEVVLGLCVNFSKTKIYDVNLKEDFLSVAASFLSCDRGNIPFKFLGVSVGMKPRRKEERKLGVQLGINLKRRLASWKLGYLSMR